MKMITTCGRQALIGAVLALLGMGSLTAQAAWPELPTHKTYVVPGYFPKNGQGDYSSSGFDIGEVRNTMENTYEGWWREYTYYRANPTNGAPIRGYFMDTKTVGEVALPWAWNPGLTQMGESNVVGLVLGTAVADVSTNYTGVMDPVPVKGRPLTIQIGTRALTDTLGSGSLSGDGVGTVNHGTGAYSFHLNVAAPEGTPIEAFYTAYIEGAAPSPGAWANFSAIVGDTGAGRFPDGRGEHFDELADEATPAVRYRRREGDALVDAPLVDGFWTPGERFTDLPGPDGLTAPNGSWDPYIHAEDTWTPVYTNGGLWGHEYFEPLRDYMGDGRGDFFYDYDFSVTSVSTSAPTRVLGTAPGGMASRNVEIWIADSVLEKNFKWNISEFDLTPPLFAGGDETDEFIVQPAEDRWVPERSLDSFARDILSFESFLDLATVGDAIADYDASVIPSLNPANPVTTFDVKTNLTIYVADTARGTNVPFQISALDLTPPNYYENGTHYFDRDGFTSVDPSGQLEGDAAHSYIGGGNTNLPVYADVPFLGRFEYEDLSSGPEVYESAYSVQVQTYLPESWLMAGSPSRLFLLTNSPNTEIYGLTYQTTPPPSRLVVSDFDRWAGVLADPSKVGFTTPLTNTLWQFRVYVDVPVYYAKPLWGRPSDTNGYTTAAGEPVLNSFVDAVGNDNQWTDTTNFVSTSLGSREIRYVPSDPSATNDSPVLQEGDAAWTYNRDVTDPPPNLRPLYGDIPALGRLEHNIDADGLVHVYQAPFEVVLSSYVDLSEALYDNLQNSPGEEFSGYMETNGAIHVFAPAPNFFTDVAARGSFDVNSTDVRVKVLVHVPLYHSMALWGEPEDAATYQSLPTVLPPPIGVENPFLDAIGGDDAPTPSLAEESYSDFISWWDPNGGEEGLGGWVPGIFGSPRGTLPPGTDATPEYWSYTEYTNYIANNYPGDAAGLIARCGDTVYDGPENWAEVDNNQYIQTAWIATLVSMNIFEDYTVGPDSSLGNWWVNRYGTPAASEMVGQIPFVSEWKPELTDDNQVQSVSTVTNETEFGTEVVTTYGSMTHPPAGTTWTYDSPREFDDLASSLYHNPDLGSLSAISMREFEGDANLLAIWDGGDLRLGEPTSPWGGDIFGHDRGDSDPGTRDTDGGDDILPLAGPYAYNTHANFGHDGANQLSLEFATHRTDGTSLTTGLGRPLGGHRMGYGYDFNYAIYNTWADSVPYARDHRDVNLNGLIDQGETIPNGSQNYFADPAGEDGGMDTMALFGWERCTEDYIDTYDAIEDFSAIINFSFPSGTGEEWGIFAAAWFAWDAGQVATDTLAAELGGPVLYIDTDSSGDFTPHVDGIWVDTTSNGVWDAMERVIHDRFGVADSETLIGFGPATALFADIGNTNGVYDLGQDLVWLDDGATAGVFDCELVLSDPFGQLEPGDGDAALLNLRTTHSIYAYPSATNFSMIWAVTNGYAGATEDYGSTNGFDLIYLGPGFTPSVGTTTGQLWVAATDGVIRYASFDNDVDLGYLPGLAVFIDDPASANGLYDGDTAISVPGGALDLSFAGVASNGTFEIGFTTNAASPGFDRTLSVAWIESNMPSNERSGEFVVFESTPFVDGMTNSGDISANIQWVDLPGLGGSTNGTFDPIVHVEGLGGEGAPLAIGDGVFYDYNANGIFNYGATTRIPLYMVGLMNPLGLASAGVLHSGNFYGTMTRDGYISGFNQNQSVGANMPSMGLLTHEQGHDTPGWPDLYDYDVSTEEVDNRAASGDLYSDAGLVHGYPDLKFRSNPAGGAFPGTRGVTIQELNYTPSAILTRDAGPQTLLLYPVERYADQYYVFRDQTNPYEYFTINYNAGNLSNTDNPLGELPSPYASPFGRGVIIGHSDYTGSPFGAPQQQRSNNRFTWLFVQADGKYELEDGVNGSEPADAFGTLPETRQFSQSTIPRAEWYDKTDSGLRIVDIRIPSEPYGPCEIDIEWSSPLGGTNGGDSTDWFWVSSGNDSDGDGIPDAWEYYWFGTHANPLAVAGAGTDYDGDGLSDYGEWLAHANPTWVSSWSGDRNPQNLSDADIDLDGDGLSNRAEVDDWNTRPRDIDSDDDGITDGDELNWSILKADDQRFTSPTYSRSPLVERALQLSPTTAYLLPETSIGLQYEREPISDFTRLRLTNWTVEAWVYLDSASETGSIVRRETLQGATTFNLSVSNNVPLASISTVAGLTYSVLGLDTIPASTWTHIAGSLASDDNSLRIFVNGGLVGTAQVQGNDPGHPGYIGGSPSSGETWLGGDGLNGAVDELRIWSRARSQTEIDFGYEKIVNSPWHMFDTVAASTNDASGGTTNGTSVVTTNATTSSETYTGTAVVNDGSLVVNLRFDDAQNVTNRLDYGARAFGAEDYVHAGNWNYAVMGMATSQFITNHPTLSLSELIPEPMDDLNEDGIPDWWQAIYWSAFDPFTSGDWDADADPDEDGLINLYEYGSRTNPRNEDTDNNGTLDGDEDPDDDGLTTREELNEFGTDPFDDDTDDDTYKDGDEIDSSVMLPAVDGRRITSPLASRSPLSRKSLVLDGGAGHVVPGRTLADTTDRFDMDSWSIECWIMPTNGVQTGDLMIRTTSSGKTNFALRLTANVPTISFSTEGGKTYEAGGNGAIPVDEWTHLAGVWDPTVNSLALYVNGQSYQAQLVVGSCATGPGVTRIGVGIEGLMDEVRFWSVPRKPEEISAFMHSISAGAVASTVEEAPTGGPTAPSVGPFTIVENETSSALWTELLAGNAIPAGVTGLSATYNGSGGAAGLYAAFPSLPGSIQPFDGIILSSGQAVDGLGPNDSSSTSTSLGIPGSDEMEALVGSATQDAVWLELSFTTDASVDGLSFNILFGSEEFPEFVGSFNDAFAAFLDGENISFDANNEPVTVNNNYFQLNNSGDTTDPDTVGKTVVDADIEYDGLTPLLVTSKALSPGAHTLKLMVADAGDSAYDSAAFLSNFKFAQVGGEGTSVATAQDIGVSGALGSGSIDLAGQYMFDDGGDTAEDFSEPLNWDYAIEGVTFNTNQAALVLGLFDADGDRMPDWWEDMFFSAVVAAVSTNDSAGDATNGTDEATSESEEISGALADDDDDGDGLRNLYEYYCDTNPNADDSNNNGVGDGEEDYDNDGLSNGHEDDAGSDPRLLDTDDDGIIDVDDFGYGFDPANALIPIVDRVLDLDGLAGTHLRLAGGPRFGLSSWAVEAWVKPAGVIASEATILEREVQTGVENYFLGVNAAALPFVRFTAADDATVVTVTAAAEYALAAGEWVHLAGAFDEESGALTLHVNGALVDGIYTVKQPVTGGVGPAFVHAGEGFEGQIDELRIWTELPASVDLATVESGSLAPDAGPGDTNATVVSLQAGTYRISYVAGEWIDAQGNPQTSVAVGEAADLAAVLAEASASGVGSFEWGGGNVYVFIPVADASGNTGAGIEYLIETEVATASRTLDELKLTATASDSRLVAYYRFDDGTHTNGTSAKAEWTWGQAQEYARGVQGDWMNEWFNGATLVGGASMVDALADAPVRASLEDKDGDGIADWWEDLFFNGNADPGVDPDGDGLSNLGEFQAGSDPFAVDSNLDGLSDYDEDSDDDGLSNGDEEDIFGSDPGDPDTDDDGYDDGDEVMGWEPAAVDNYGTVAQVSSPVESISPHIRRSYVAAGRSMAAPHSERFAFRGVEEVILPGPTVEITAPEDGADIDVRFTDIAATITQVGPPIESVLLYINDQFMADYGAAESFNDTVIINSGENVVTVYGIDTDGNLGSDTITINGTFPPADIRVTQTWTPAGDMDTWLVDPQGRHMGWSTGGPGLPDNVDEQMPGAFLDIDDVSGTGPENITLEEPNSIAGEYEVWMNNYSNGGNPLSTVRVLVLEGRPGESYVEFGPQSVSASDGNGSDANAWWHVTTITMPEGTMDPPGSPILPPDNIAAPEVGATSENGWTMECWAKPGDSAQSGAIAAYRDAYGNEPFVIGLTNNMPFVRLRAASGTIYEAMGGAIDVDVWTHLAFVYSSTDHTLRLHINGLLAAAQIVLESRDESIGTLYVDTTLTGGAAPLSFTDIHLDELRIWKVARNGGLIAGQMHQIQKPTDTIVAMYRFDDGGTDIEDGRYPLNSLYDLGQGTIPDTAFNTKPGVDGDRYTVDDVAAGATPDGENDYVTSMEYAPVMGIIDGDDDGIANWYEDLFSTTNMLGGLVPGEDLDGDGLLNLFEYHARTNPDDDDSDGDGTIDPEEDDDGDDVANLDEQIHSTDPWLVDTDDDGYNDNVEIRYGSGATNALSPAFMRALHVDGSAASRVEMPPALRLALSDWTVSASVYLEMPVTAGSIIAREVQTGQYTYRLGIGADRVPYIAFTAGDGTTVQLTAPDLRALPLDEWIALEASYSTQTGDLRLLIEGEQVAHLLSETRPKTFGLGPVHGTIGDGINGYIDDVMILDGAGGTQLYYSFDDGTHADGVSGEVDFRRGQVQDLAPLPELANNWMLEWRDAGTLVGGATIELYPSMGSTDDTDGDGLPDAWEIANGLSPFETDTDGDGIADGSEDGDLDGLVNWTEYRAGTDPNDPDSDGDGTLDKDEDPDLDGLVNFDEQLNSSRPDLPDTDDDGLSDYDEVNGPIYTLPIASLSPAVARALELTSGTQTLELPDEARFRLANAWTIEAWVWLDTAFSGGNVLSRSVGASVNYQLGIEADGTPYVRAVGVYEGVEHPYMAADAVPMARRGDWYHLAGVWTRSSGDLQLYVNGELRTVESMPDVPGIFSATGAVSTVVGGSGFVGRIDEVRIWNAGRSALELRDGAYAVLDASEPNLAAYYRFDDGTHAAGTSGTNALTMGQVEDFAIANRNWDLVWTNAATLAGGATVSEVLTPIPAAAFADVDQDELPDFWEATIFGNIEGGLPASDVDSDGLTTLFEYRALMHPARMSTFDDEVEDGLRDPDGDGLLNQEEVVKATLPGVKDTDDDGLTDHEELTAQDDPSTPLSPARRSNPRRSMDPPRPRSLVFDGASRAVVPAEPNHSLAAWTAEAWVRPTAAADGIVLRRATADLPGMRGINYELGVENRGGTLFAYSQYTTDSSGSALQVRLDTTQPGEATTNGILVGSMIAPEEWTHLAATYQPTNYTFKLYVNGDLASYRVDAVGTPALGAGENAAVGSEFTIGGGSLLAGVVQNGFEGHIDEVRIMRGALSDATILEHASGFGEFYGLVQAVDNSGTAAIQTLPPVVATGYNHVAGEMLVRFKTGVSAAIQSNLVTTLGLETMRKNKVVPVSRLRIKDGTALKDKLVEVQANPNVLYAEPNYVRSVSALPDDPLIEQLWAMHNTGQNGGTDDADIDALEAWDRVTGSEQVVVAVIDTGVNYNHTDLADNMWINVGETAGNGVDDDGNGFVDDVYGYDFINSDADPIDDHDHGSHCAGTIGGVGNNGTGVVGVNWTVRIMALKAFSAQGGGSSADIVAAIDYAVLMGAHVSNNSYGGSGFSQAEYDAVEAARNAGHLFVAAAGNDGTDNDTIPQYPASFDLDNIIAVAATDRNDGIAGFSCFGLESVDLGAPGVDIHSTLSGGGYGNMSGTSMATPHTTGAAALIMAANGQLTYDQVRQLIFNGVDLIPSMDGKVATAGRLNLFNSLPEGGGGGGGGPTGPLDIVAYFTFNDAGVHAEDFTVAADYLRGWHRAARLEGAMFDADEFFDNLIDSDGDALPDWWEIGMGLDPYDASGDNGTWADPDMDGLHNYAEFMVASRHRPIVSDPLAWDSDTDGFADFFEWDGLMYRIFGEIYTDFDSMEDAWEVANGLDPLHYDAHRDLDDDGWSNFGEFMAQADPGNASEYPVPSLRFNFRYDGVVAGLPTIMAYSSASMDGVPDAVFDPTALPTVPVEDELFGISGAPAYNVNLDNENLVPGSLVIQDVTHSFVDDGQGALLGTLAGSAGTVDYASGSVELTYETPATPGNIMTASYEYYETVPSYPGTIIYQNATDGYVREGDNWFFAFIDQNSDGDWQDGEPSGTAIGHPIRVDWNSGGPIDIAMTDDMPGYGRFAWTAEPDATEYTVRVSLSGWPPLISPDTVIKAPRTWFHEQDFRNAGVNGLVAGTYQWEVYSTIDGAVLPVEVGTFLVENASVMSVPEPVWPVGQHWLHAQNELRWRMDSDATEFRVQIARDINFTDILFTSPREIAPAPQEGLDGTPGTNTVTTRYTLPIYAGDGDFTNGVYYWHVQSFNADNSTSYSDPGSMTVDLTGSAVGSFSISGDVVYFGKVTNGSFVVQAFSSPGFGGVPMGQVTLPNTSDVPGWPRNAIPFKLAGLRQGSYHVRAFLDQDGDSEKDAWESSGFVQITAYSPEMMTLPVSVANRWLPLWLADTDQDHIADDWEFQYTGDLLTMGPGPVRGYTDQTPGGLNDYETYAAMPMNDSPFDADAAGPDGIPFWVKLAFDIDIYSYYAFAITTVGTDPSDYAVVRWPAPLGTSVQTQNNGTAVMSNNGVTLSYRLQYSSDLITWADLTGSAPVTYDPVAGEFEVVDQFHTGRVGFYRVLLSATQ